LDTHAKSERREQTLAKKTFAYPNATQSDSRLLSSNDWESKGVVFSVLKGI
jgi:hypothetical protein